jgi:hypothetical protein
VDGGHAHALASGVVAHEGGAAVEAFDDAVHIEVEAELRWWRGVGEALENGCALFVVARLLLALAARHGQRALRQLGFGCGFGFRFQVVEKTLHLVLLAREPPRPLGDRCCRRCGHGDDPRLCCAAGSV